MTDRQVEGGLGLATLPDGGDDTRRRCETGIPPHHEISKPSISVGIPSHNQGHFLAEALDALLNQTVRPDEIVVSDDSSTDETMDILRRYQGRVRVIRPPARLSMVAHFNFLVTNMSGDWFSVLGGDDAAEPEFVEVLSQAASRQPDAVLVRGGWLLASQTGQVVGHHRLWTTAAVTRPPRTLLEELRGPKPSLSAVLFNRSAWSEAGGFPERLRHSFDWGLYLRLSPLGSFITTRRRVVRFRSGYPRSKLIGRLTDKAHDERVIGMEIIPEMVDKLGMSRARAIRTAAESRLKAVLREAGLATDENMRADIATELRPLAMALGLDHLIDDYMAGLPAPTGRFRRLSAGASVIDAQARTVSDRFLRRGGVR